MGDLLYGNYSIENPVHLGKLYALESSLLLIVRQPNSSICQTIYILDGKCSVVGTSNLYETQHIMYWNPITSIESIIILINKQKMNLVSPLIESTSPRIKYALIKAIGAYVALWIFM